MYVEHHPLIKEFPEFKAAIHELKEADEHFADLFDKYHKIDKEVIRMEEDIEPAADHVIEDAKKRRLSLKDQLFALLKEHGPD